MDPQQQEQQQTQSTKIQRLAANLRKYWWAWTLGLVIILGGTASASYFIGKNQVPAPVAVVTATPEPTESPTPSPTPTPIATELITESGVTWLDAPQKLADLKLFKTNADLDSVTYYKVGTDQSKDIILGIVLYNDPSGPHETLLLKKSNTEYDLLASHSKDLYDGTKYNGPELAKGVTQNTSKSYKVLAARDTLESKGKTLKLGFSFYALFTDIQSAEGHKLTEFAKIAYGTLYTDQVSNEGGVDLHGFILRRPNGTIRQYQYEPEFISSDSVPAVTFTDGTKNTKSYSLAPTRTCGTPNAVSILASGSTTDLKAAGKTSGNETIYEFSSASNSTLQYLYKLSAPDGKYYDYSTSEPKEMTLTAEQYLAQHGVLLYKDAFGRVIAMTNQTFGPNAECGKPVVYLYPTNETKVSVKVGADVTVSDPAYNNGWNVIAQPSGKLTNSDGKTYDSLFWEGLGHGIYPEIREGFIVPKDKVDATLRDHLKKLGLNEKESADFLEFWLPRMPNTPYTRLTWFGTRQMNALAPLNIEPKPDSVIRIFLDFEGLEKPITLPAQRLGAIERKGFTAIEWGGLLRK